MTRVVESFVQQADEALGGFDRLVIAEPWFAVLDGSTPKYWNRGPSVAHLVDALAHELPGFPHDLSMLSVVRRLSETALRLGALGRAGPCVVLGVINTAAGWAGTCGDIALLIDGTMVSTNQGVSERVISGARALAAEAMIASGLATLESLRDHDISREAIAPLHRWAVAVRNTAGPLGYGAVDGDVVPSAKVREFEVGRHASEVVLATDGYPAVAATLQDCEDALARRLVDDPLMLMAPPQAKGMTVGKSSYDDRAFLRIAL